MDSAQLLEFYTSGGDLSTLSDADLQSLAGMMGAGREPVPKAPFGGGLITSIPADKPADIGAIPGKDVISFMLKALSLGLGLAPGTAGMPLAARGIIQTLLGSAEGAINPPEGMDRGESAV